ncbi:hypothetical protein THRCLA_20040 [Thraustotheca clavata]|uniref:Uncharacterized protein n=1 Tax=Thraustotheca clavata TaxID=74557 RepID=A0A1W0AC66_9STRA|nr:hypothetical protein THRCLA_20040 [Thraustotheca clavata]
MISFNSVLPLASEERASFTVNVLAKLMLQYGIGLDQLWLIFLTSLSRRSCACAFCGVNLSLMVLMNVYFGQLLTYAMPRVDIAALMGALKIPSGYQWLYTITPPRFSLALLVAETFTNCDDGTQIGCQIMPAAGIPLKFNS